MSQIGSFNWPCNSSLTTSFIFFPSLFSLQAVFNYVVSYEIKISPLLWCHFIHHIRTNFISARIEQETGNIRLYHLSLYEGLTSMLQPCSSLLGVEIKFMYCCIKVLDVSIGYGVSSKSIRVEGPFAGVWLKRDVASVAILPSKELWLNT